MEIEILKSKKIDHKTWYLCQGNLLEYLENLKPNFYDFAIQRRIVKNTYLDTIYKTIKSGDPIPVITLTYNQPSLNLTTQNTADLDLSQVEILDGLQRTFRLWAYKKVSDKFEETKKPITVFDFGKLIKEENDLFFETGVISSTLLRKLIETDEISKIKDVYKKFDIYFTVWAGLSEDEVVDKMLVLNAGQKSVSKTHQYELLFLQFFNNQISKQSKIELFREKDKLANDIKKGKRDIGSFMFSTIILGLQSFVEMKPLRVSTEDLISSELDSETELTIYEIVFTSGFIEKYLTNLYLLDNEVFIKEEQKGKEWFVKDTTISGIMAAIGRYIDIQPDWTKTELEDNFDEGIRKLQDKIKVQGFMLEEFTNEYNTLSSRQVNIGYFIRKVIMEYTLELLKNNTPDWKSIFSTVKENK